MSDALPLDVLVCPACRGALAAEPIVLTCRACAARYDRVLHVADLVPADVRGAMATDTDPRWRRWREAIRGLEAWRARRRARARGGPLPSDGTREAVTRELFERAAIAGLVVDVGAKDGAKRREMPPGVRYVGVDPMAEHVPGLPPDAVVVRGVAEALPIADGAADVVVSLAALDYFVDPARALREMARVLRPGGRLALLVSVVPRAVARARQADSRGARLVGALRAAPAVGTLAAGALAATALLERDRPHTHYFTREALLALVSERFEVAWVREVPQPTSTIVHLVAGRR